MTCYECNDYGFVCNAKTGELTERCMKCNPPIFSFCILHNPAKVGTQEEHREDLAHSLKDSFNEAIEALDAAEIEELF